MYIDMGSGQRAGWCWPSAAVCEARRKKVVEKAFGTPSECIILPTAFCMYLLEDYSMARQLVCGPTREECDALRAAVFAQSTRTADQVSECTPTRNTDSYRLDIGEKADGPP